MPFFTRNPTANETPDTGQGGSAVTGNINTGHGSTTSLRAAGSGTLNRTCRWSGFAASPSGQIALVILKLDWNEDGAIVADGTSEFLIQYTINGGGAWVDIINHDNVVSPASSNSQVVLSNAQDLTQVQVRDRLQAVSSDAPDSGSITADISNIRIEVTTVDQPPPIMIM
jgi:hypothetical protein